MQWEKRSFQDPRISDKYSKNDWKRVKVQVTRNADNRPIINGDTGPIWHWWRKWKHSDFPKYLKWCFSAWWWNPSRYWKHRFINLWNRDFEKSAVKSQLQQNLELGGSKRDAKFWPGQHIPTRQQHKLRYHRAPGNHLRQRSRADHKAPKAEQEHSENE